MIYNIELYYQIYQIAQKKGNYISYEPGPRTIIYENKLQDWNLNVIIDDHRTIKSKFNKKLFIYIIIIVVIVMILIAIINSRK
jgi:hypothetical protein